MLILVATDRDVVVMDIHRGVSVPAQGITDRPTCLAADPSTPGRAWCGTHRGGVFRSDDGGRSRVTSDEWERVRDGWPERPSTIAPLLCAGETDGELRAADERGVHRSDDGGKSWRLGGGYPASPQHLRGLALVG